MHIAIFSKVSFVGSVVVENEQVGWIHRADERIGRIEIDWGSEDQEHIASAYVGGNCVVTVALERYGQNYGKICQHYNEIGRVRPERGGMCSVYKGSEPIGFVESKADGISNKHLILFGGAGAAVLLGLCRP